MKNWMTWLVFAWSALLSERAAAFCGFYVAGGDTKLFNNATLTVLMREGTRTVLSMENNYEGPPADFAMVVPVPVVLDEDDVRTLDRAVFDRVDALTAPRLVEYWEQDPCNPWNPEEVETYAYSMSDQAVELESADEDYQVTVEARFTVGEYDIVILSAGESSGLERWLTDNHYRIPQGAAAVLAPYIQQGMKFFVAKVDVTKVRFEAGQARLSPLRFHFDSIDFTLPIRLGLLNSKGKQDLITILLAPNQRYEVANYDNVTIPTNLDVKDEVRSRFGQFYVALFDRVMQAHPRSVVTEYSWSAGSCDPCPTPPLSLEDLVTLGLDALPEPDEGNLETRANEFVITRLHARYDTSDLGEDFVFRTAVPIVGGREGDRGATITARSPYNNFQARYIIRHEWSGSIECENPQRYIWGGPPNGGESNPVTARNTAFTPRDQVALEELVDGELSELKLLKAGGKPLGSPPRLAPVSNGCGACALARSPEHTETAWLTWLSIWGLVCLRRKTRRIVPARSRVALFRLTGKPELSS